MPNFAEIGFYQESAMPAIRLIGEHHTSHRGGKVLTVGDEAAARSSPNIVTLAHARNLVAHGEAEWVGEPPADEPQQDHPEETKPS
jgi:hypothetical protein